MNLDLHMGLRWNKMKLGDKYAWGIFLENNEFLGLYETGFGAFSAIYNWAIEHLPAEMDESEIQTVLEGLKYDYVHCALDLKSFGVEDYIYARPIWLQPTPELLK